MHTAFQRILEITKELVMPQASEELREEWTYESALDWIKGTFRWPGGWIKARDGYVPTEKDLSAIDYLVCEWDFAWDGINNG